MSWSIGRSAIRIRAGICAVIFAVAAPASIANAYSAQGQGTSDHPYLISTCAQLQEINNNLGASYKLMRNIDCSTFGTFTMIGNYFASSGFTGTLDGNRLNIVGLHTGTGGLFDLIDGGTVKNLQLRDSTYTISTSIYAGTVADAAVNGATLSNIHSNVTLNGTGTQVGGLVGQLGSSTITESSFTGHLNVSNTGTTLGGLVAIMGDNASITDSYSRGTLSNGQTVGGLVGYLDEGPATISRSYSASILGHASGYEGGLVGELGATMTPPTITDSFSASTLGGGDASAGAIIGSVDYVAPTGTTYFDSTLTDGVTDCSGTPPEAGSVDCTAIDTSSLSDYFQNPANPPLNDWDFNWDGQWEQRDGDYPELLKKDVINTLTWGDYNADGIDDSFQANTYTPTNGDATPTTFVVDPSSGCITDNGMFWNVEAPWDPADEAGYTEQTPNYWSIDLYCTTPGTAIPVTVIFDKVYDTSHSVLRHYDGVSHTYATIPATFSTVTMNGVQYTQASYTITEGGPLDGDGVADGFIQDPIALVSAPMTAADTTTTTTGTNAIPGAPNTGFARQSPVVPTPATSHTRSIASLVVSGSLLLVAGILVVIRKRVFPK